MSHHSVNELKLRQLDCSLYDFGLLKLVAAHKNVNDLVDELRVRYLNCLLFTLDRGRGKWHPSSNESSFLSRSDLLSFRHGEHVSATAECGHSHVDAAALAARVADVVLC